MQALCSLLWRERARGLPQPVLTSKLTHRLPFPSLALAANPPYRAFPDMKLKPLLVLVADDEAHICALLSLWLGELGHAVKLVASAKEAAGLLLQHQFDLVVTDVLMPEGDGLDLIAQVRHAQPSACILAISGGGRYIPGDNCLKIAMDMGAHAALMKPFNREQLLAGVEKALAPQSKLVCEQ